jgi:uncharacterized protein (DUF2345 family)
MTSVSSDAETTTIMAEALVRVINDERGMRIISEEGLPVEISVDETLITISPEGVVVESAEVNITAEAAMEVEAGGDFDLSVGGLIAAEAGDVDIDAAAMQIAAGLFTVE